MPIVGRQGASQVRCKRDYYEILGVERSASDDQIKRAYRKLAKQHHPDRNPDDPAAEQKFKEVQQAYQVLRDPDKRAQYDRFGEAGVGQWATKPGGERVYQWGGASINFEDLEDLMSAFGGSGGQRASVFEQFFGGRGRARPRTPAPQRGTDEHRQIELTFEQAARGAVVTVKLKSGSDGRSETLEVRVPPGIENGKKIRVPARGHAGRGGGPRGDLYLVCSVRPHPFFTRSGLDIFLDVPVTLAEAALGTKIEVPTLNGRATVTIPPRTRSGTRLRLRGRGVPKPGEDEPGDQYVVIGIVPPATITDEQRRLFEQLRAHDSDDPRAQYPWYQGTAK